jgi:hypothetical protein
MATLVLEAKGRREAVLSETRQVLGTAVLAIETVLQDYGDDDGRTLTRTAETLRRWRQDAERPRLPGL